MAGGVPLVHHRPSVFVRRVVIAVPVKERVREEGSGEATPGYTSRGQRGKPRLSGQDLWLNLSLTIEDLPSSAETDPLTEGVPLVCRPSVFIRRGVIAAAGARRGVSLVRRPSVFVRRGVIAVAGARTGVSVVRRCVQLRLHCFEEGCRWFAAPLFLFEEGSSPPPEREGGAAGSLLCAAASSLFTVRRGVLLVRRLFISFFPVFFPIPSLIYFLHFGSLFTIIFKLPSSS
uniref:Uncharacterized protein n=1 Tax=Nelumbo nucifera TaxID=4432 RepID=A0A822ZUJ1_NELNU|nr:TPA_asm: hypothetical protein HUJ06_016897 [Nelumbo nucifera]